VQVAVIHLMRDPALQVTACRSRFLEGVWIAQIQKFAVRAKGRIAAAAYRIKLKISTAHWIFAVVYTMHPRKISPVQADLSPGSIRIPSLIINSKLGQLESIPPDVTSICSSVL